ncbi:MAG: ABC transporter permease [Clostridium sp.]|uniref:ABC transporter permease n=1 Tax=Clostridium sp. TaxID=1506 RepID=UPI003F2C5783
MNLLKRVLKNKWSTIYLIIAFSVSILVFIIAMTIFNNKNEMLKKYNVENNKEIGFLSKEEVNYKEVQKLLENEDISLEIQFYDEYEKLIISTELIGNGLTNWNNISSGTKFNAEDIKNNENQVMISKMLDNEKKLIDINGFEEGIRTFEVKGVFDDLEKNIVFSNKVFFEKVGEESLSFGLFRIFIRGEKENLEKCIGILKDNITNAKINIFDYMKEDRNEEVTAFLEATMLILLITIINSIGITAFWINGRKKELSIRKALGGKNSDLRRLYLKELVLIGGISMMVAWSSYICISRFYSGYIAGLSLKFNVLTFIQASGLVLIVAFLISIPSLIYLSNLNVIEVLRGD